MPLRSKRSAGTNGFHADISHRPYGRPEVNGSTCASFAHSDDLTMLVAADQLVACDLEAVSGTSRSWPDLLGPQHHALAKLVSGHSTEEFDTAATRVWSALECLKKAEIGGSAPLSMLPGQEKGWVLFRSGPNLVATFSAGMTGRTASLVVAILAAEQSKRVAVGDSSILSEKPISACGD